jgi:surfactin synthase thioesterase subunit
MLTVPSVSSWIVTPRPLNSGTRLFCFPYAGGGASVFRSWADNEFLADVEVCAVQLPGRETRITESPVGDLRRLVHMLCEALEPYLDRPFVFFGHSIGALVSFELESSQAICSCPVVRLHISRIRSGSVICLKTNFLNGCVGSTALRRKSSIIRN